MLSKVLRAELDVLGSDILASKLQGGPAFAALRVPGKVLQPDSFRDTNDYDDYRTVDDCFRTAAIGHVHDDAHVGSRRHPGDDGPYPYAG